ncbi:hypothetical protein Celaphus_00005978 [Cervus elaphus hippelaphus]|uniref:Uncharacterized protein n=1 Tax=Cervus elaphus hippelaphus TaxID=46360 RepID=A0A212CT80_CEREH|nr:hypothetical protein Celaphus_00005978 [Cervus elaphus hippelaphus]
MGTLEVAGPVRHPSGAAMVAPTSKLKELTQSRRRSERASERATAHTYPALPGSSHLPPPLRPSLGFDRSRS